MHGSPWPYRLTHCISQYNECRSHTGLVPLSLEPSICPNWEGLQQSAYDGRFSLGTDLFPLTVMLAAGV